MLDNLVLINKKQFILQNGMLLITVFADDCYILRNVQEPKAAWRGQNIFYNSDVPVSFII